MPAAPIHDSTWAVDFQTMSISPVSGNAASQEVERAVAVMKKTKEVEKATADSLTQLVKDAASTKGQRVSAYA